MTDNGGFDSKLAHTVFLQKYSMNGLETWEDTCKRVVKYVTRQYLSAEIQNELYDAMVSKKFIPAGRYLYSAGRPKHQVFNCFLMKSMDSREGWAKLLHDATSVLMLGGGVGVDYSDVRAEGAVIKGTGGLATGPIALMNIMNETGRGIMAGGSRRSALMALLSWKHGDVFKFMESKNHSEELKALKEKDFTFPLSLDGTNISVSYDTEFFIAIKDRKHPLHKHAKKVWEMNCLQAFSTAEPGMSFDYLNDKNSLRNPCAEAISDTNNDRCNLGTVWLPKIKDKDELARITYLGTQFLLCGGLYTDSPLEEVERVGRENNRIGLGLGGFHEWLMERGYGYEVGPELHQWLNIFERESDAAAYIESNVLDVNLPKSKRAIAPNGTLGLMAGTTSGIEPLFAKAYMRRYLDGTVWKAQYVVDGVVKRLLDKGTPMEVIQDSADITFKQRVKFQADVQQYIDMGISSTCNLPSWGSETNNEETLKTYSKLLLKYAPRLRGFTCYPDGCRGGQPLVRVSLEEALAHEGLIFEEKEHSCVNGVCGT